MATKRKPMSVRQVALKHGFRSGLEDQVAQELTSKGVGFTYEEVVIEYIRPATKHKYTADFQILANGIIVETKGRFLLEDRKKHLLIKQQYPHLDIRFVFSNSKTRISKRSPTTYGIWCEKHGFLYADKTIPEEWLKETTK